jgi:hypothetical protein
VHEPPTGLFFYLRNNNEWFNIFNSVCRLAIICTTADEIILRRIAAGNSFAHLSSNAFKRIDDESYILMMTYRRSAGYVDSFKEELEALTVELTQCGFQLEKEISEFSIYDTNISHDAAWVSE